MKITVSKIIELTRGKLIKGSTNYEFSRICYDVIKGAWPRGEFLYIPYINSYRNIDSTGEVQTMPQRGAKGVILDVKMINKFDITNFEVVIAVTDLELSVLNLARYFRNENNNVIIGVTGSSGKTTSKELISEILKESKVPHVKTLRNINGYGGATHTIFNLQKEEVGVLEVGVNGLKRLPILSKTISPNYLLVTNIYPTHFDKIPKLEDVARYKLTLSKYMKRPEKKVLFGDCDYLKKYMDNKTVTFGWNYNNDYSIVEVISSDSRGSEFIVYAKGDQYTVTTPLLGKHNIINVLGSFAVTSEMGISPKVIIEAIKHFSGIKDDFYATMGIYKLNNWKFLDDSQHFNLPALRMGLETFSDISNGKGGVVLMSYDYKFNSEHFDFKELLVILVEYKKIIKKLLLVGEGWNQWKNIISKNLSSVVESFDDKVEAALFIKSNVHEEYIYIKGDFNERLRGIINMLEEDKFEIR